jgi:hypothetical protein
MPIDCGCGFEEKKLERECLLKKKKVRQGKDAIFFRIPSTAKKIMSI